jgi:pimeloyl-ACP methyl ester carboxylesterase
MPLPLVLLPGMNCSPRLWDGVVEELETGKLDGGTAEVVIEHLDQPSIDGQVDALLDRLPRRFALGGLSLGAIVAMAVHRRAPERVGGLCLVATNSRAPTVEQHAAWRAQLELLGSGATARDLQDHLIPLLLGDHLTPALRRLTLDMADEVGSDRLAAQLRLQLTRVDERPGLHAATIPCVVVAAADDQICPLNRHTEISELVPGSQLVVVADAPHLVTLSHPQRVAEALAVWLHRLG